MSAAITDAVIIFENKLPSLRLSEREGPRPVESRQHGNARVADSTQRDPETLSVRELDKRVRDDDRLVSALLPVGDGLLTAVKR